MVYSFDDWKKAKELGINLRVCAYEVGLSICGKMMGYTFKMPEGVPDMPLCKEHYDVMKLLFSESDIAEFFERLNNGS